MPHNNTNIVFPRFSEFPAEIRIKIWRFACTPRIVRLPLGTKALASPKRQRRPDYHMTTSTPHFYALKFGSQPPQLFESSAPPPLLTVNRESRSEILPFYQAFSPAEATQYFYGWKGQFSPSLTIDADIDIIYLDALSKLNINPYHTPSTVKPIRHLAIFDDSRGPTNVNTAFSILSDISRTCPNLENLCLCLPDPPDWYGSAIKARSEQRRDALETALRQKWFDKTRTIVATPSTLHTTSEGWAMLIENGKRWEKVIQVSFLSELKDGVIRRRPKTPLPEFSLEEAQKKSITAAGTLQKSDG